MIADIGTRRCSSIEEVKPDSIWINGFKWMKGNESGFPMMTAKDISLNTQETQEIKRETQENEFKPIAVETTYYVKDDKNIMEDIQSRFQFSHYIIDSNRHRFTTVVRITAIVLKFIKNLRMKTRSKSKILGIDYPKENLNTVIISEEEINEAKRYFYKKATLEVKHFTNPAQYKDISREIDGLLMYTGRILPNDEITILGKATQVMKDLTATSFCVPLVEKVSPVAYSVVNDIHWHHETAQHCGIETVWRYVLMNVYIIEGRSLVKKIRKSCERCRYLEKKTLDVAMGPVSRYNLTIAPAFYITQVDLAGPFLAYSHHHKRSTIKIWLVVFCCATTSTSCIKIMEDYSTTAFLQAFTRFSCEVGYPKILLSDEGSQLVKGCGTMRLKFWDIKIGLHKDVAVELEVCPVGGHNMHGRVERKIQEIKKSIEKTLLNKRLSVMQWETISASISNSINNMPLALRNRRSNLESMDLITPNRLRLGRNNERSPVGHLSVINDMNKTIKENENIFNAWFEIWLSCHVPKLMEQQKWYKSGLDLKEGDIVLFVDARILTMF